MTDRPVLYTLALQADEHLSTVLTTLTGRTRWTMKASDYQMPEVREALRAKIDADEAWLAFLRASRTGGNHVLLS